MSASRRGSAGPPFRPSGLTTRATSWAYCIFGRRSGRCPRRDQETLLLVGWDGLDVAAAAVVVGCTRRTFAVRLHRARRRLRQALDETPVGEAAPGALLAFELKRRQA
ncbi:sigma factor-like helix-turn-helix DNA-binding protein [Streptomyces sp. PmtG]